MVSIRLTVRTPGSSSSCGETATCRDGPSGSAALRPGKPPGKGPHFLFGLALAAGWRGFSSFILPKTPRKISASARSVPTE